jgi:kynureninase
MTASLESPAETLSTLAQNANLKLTQWEFAQHLDARDPLRHLRDAYHIPSAGNVANRKMHDPAASATHHDYGNQVSTGSSINTRDDTCVYFCGNSLGLQPKAIRRMLSEELDVWAER